MHPKHRRRLFAWRALLFLSGRRSRWADGPQFLLTLEATWLGRIVSQGCSIQRTGAIQRGGSAFTMYISQFAIDTVSLSLQGNPVQSFWCHKFIRFDVVLHRVLIQLVTTKDNSKQPLLAFRQIQEPDTRLSWGDADGPELFNMNLSALVLVGHSPAQQ